MIKLLRLIPAVFALFVLTSCTSSYHTLQAGHYGVIVHYGQNGGAPTFTNVQTGVGIWVNNWTERWVDYPNAQQSLTMVRSITEGRVGSDDSVACHDSNGVPVNVDVTITWRVDPNHIGDLYILRPDQPLYDKGGNDIDTTVVRRIARSVIPVVCGEQTYIQLYTGLGKLQLASDALALLQKEASKEYVVIDGVYPGEMYLQQSQQDAISRTANAQAQVQVAILANQQVSAQATAEVVKANADAQAARIEAQGESDANKALESSLSPAIIQDRIVTKWDGHLPQVSGSASTLVQLPEPRATATVVVPTPTVALPTATAVTVAMTPTPR